MKVRWTKPTLDRLKAHKVWLESLDNANPSKIIAAISNSAKSLERLGDIGRPSSVKGHRELSVRLVPYVIIYRIEGKLCVIATVYHTAQDQKI
jgi:plasmid stabilization system protein ParE